MTKLHFRGGRIFNAVMEDLLAKGMKNARNVREVDDLTLFSSSLLIFFHSLTRTCNYRLLSRDVQLED